MPNRHDPLVPPDPEEWLAVDEEERIELVLEYHQRADIELPNQTVHAAIHAIVENQVALGDEVPVGRTLERLMREGLDRHDAIHAVGTVLAGLIWELMRGGDVDTTDPNLAYHEKLRSLTAQEWLDSYVDPEG